MSGIDELRDEVIALRTEVARQRRWSRGLAGAAMLGGALLVLGGAGSPPNVIRADRLEIGDGDPGIVLEHGPDGPTITLSSGDERTTRLSMAGLELTITAAEPSEVPTMGDPGLGEEEPRVSKGEAITVDVGTDMHVSHLEVTCTSGFRNRAMFTGGRAVMELPAASGDCVASFGGGMAIMRLAIRPGDDLVCGRLGKGAGLTCRKQVPRQGRE
jgi:hypothetical protein